MKVLAAIDFSELSDAVVEQARSLVERQGGELWLLHVAEPEPAFIGYEAGPAVVRDALAQRFHREHQDLQAIAGKLRDSGINATALLIQGSTVDTVLQQADQLNVDMLIAGTHGRSLARDLLLGNVSSGLVRGTCRPLLLVPEAASKR